MSFDSDIAVLGTGIAPLIAATYLLSQGKSVLLLNPDRDFFLEDSELPLDPFLPGMPSPSRIARSLPEQTLKTLRPDFPGAIEFWQPGVHNTGYHDFAAPHVRSRGRLWISTAEALERLYVEASDAGHNPQILDGLLASRRVSSSPISNDFSGILIPKLCDVDVVRYRNGLLEFVRERLGPDHLISNADQIEWMPGGIRFHSKGTPCTARLRDGMLVFWTPKLTPWIINHAKQAEVIPNLPQGVRLWEQWNLDIGKPLDPNTISIYNGMTLWNDFEGPPHEESLLAILRPGPLIPLESFHSPESSLHWASADSLSALSDLCHHFLKWEHLSIRAFKPRAVLEWTQEEPWLLCQTDPMIQVVPASDGPLVDIARVVRSACNKVQRE